MRTVTSPDRPQGTGEDGKEPQDLFLSRRHLKEARWREDRFGDREQLSGNPCPSQAQAEARLSRARGPGEGLGERGTRGWRAGPAVCHPPAGTAVGGSGPVGKGPSSVSGCAWVQMGEGGTTSKGTRGPKWPPGSLEQSRSRCGLPVSGPGRESPAWGMALCHHRQSPPPLCRQGGDKVLSPRVKLRDHLLSPERPDTRLTWSPSQSAIAWVLLSPRAQVSKGGFQPQVVLAGSGTSGS